jgi:hypothetical protein
VPTYRTPQVSTSSDDGTASVAPVSPRIVTRAATPPRSKDLLSTARQELDNARERASGFIDDVRSAYTRTERSMSRYLGNDPQGRVSARD